MKLVVAIVIATLLLVTTQSDAVKNRVMPWMCLERCGDNATQIQQQLDQFKQHVDLLSAVSFELYNLGANGQLVVNELTRVSDQISALGLETYAMISSYPYPPEFLDWMRYVFTTGRDSFIDQCISQAKELKLTGFNVDWEPTGSATADDAKSYAEFLTYFSDKLHAAGIKVTADVAGWNPIWDFNLLGKTSVDRLLTMSTYTGNWTSWQNSFNKATTAIPLDKLGIGLQSTNPSKHDEPFTWREMQLRFQFIMAGKIQEIDIWRAPIPDLWWDFIRLFVKGGDN